MMIGARTAAWAKSGYTAKDYVQDGLVGQVDGIENAGFGVHDPNAVKLVDLIGGIGNLIPIDANFSIGSDCITFNNSYGVGTKEIVEREFTHEIVAKRRWNTGSATGYFSTFSDRAYQDILTYSSWTPYCKRTSLKVKLTDLQGYYDKAVYIAMSQDSDGSIKFYINGQLVANDSKTMNSININSWRTTYTAKENMDFMAHRRYSKALTASEIAANYAIDKARFNIPDAT